MGSGAVGGVANWTEWAGGMRQAVQGSERVGVQRCCFGAWPGDPQAGRRRSSGERRAGRHESSELFFFFSAFLAIPLAGGAGSVGAEVGALNVSGAGPPSC